MAKRKAAPKSLYVTEYSNSMYFFEEIRNPVYELRPLRFPLLGERDAGQIEYESEVNRRTYHGDTPKDPPREGGLYGRYTLRDGFEYDAGPNRVISNAQRFRLPDGFKVTATGIEELEEGEIPPDRLEPPIGDFEYIRDSENTRGIGDQEFFINRYTIKEARFDGKPNVYYPVGGGSDRVPRLFYYNYVKPSYQAPVYPNTRTSSRGVPTRWGNKLKGDRNGD